MTTNYCVNGSSYGIKTICSNIPISEWNTKQPAGTYYNIDIHFTVPIAQIAELSAFSNLITIPQLEASFLAAGYAAQISDLKIGTNGAYDLIISFTANSPWIYLVIAVILGLLAVIGIYLIDQIAVTVSKSPALSVGAAAISIAAAIGISLLAVSYFNQKRRKKHE
jgi:hypothetical protein